MTKERKKVSANLADDVQFACDRKCCVCRKPGKQIHHIDGNPSNNVFDNLAFLCFDCHNEASISGGLGRKLAPGTIKKYKDCLVKEIETKRQHALKLEESDKNTQDTPTEDQLRQLMLEAIAIDRIKEIHSKFAPDEWERMEELAYSLHRFDRFDYSLPVLMEIISALYTATCYTRVGMPASTARAIASAATNTLPFGAKRLNPKDIELLDQAADGIGFSLAHDGGKYLRDLEVVRAGADVMCYVLRYAKKNGQTELQEKVEQLIERAKDSAREHNDGPFEEAIKTLDFYRMNALGF